MQKLYTREKYLEKWISEIIGFLMAIMVINVSLAVFFRYVLRSSLAWSEELGRYMMVWVGYLGCSLGTKEDSHVGIQMFVDFLPQKFRTIIALLVRIIIDTFLVIIFFESFSHLRTLSIQRSSAMEIPMIIPYLSVTVGVFLMFVFNTIKIVTFFLRPIENKT
ncbi:MAG: TRAP transporter small permease [Spirochaetes bacterium]|nr:TRAP transporter small permease [Spirochaetota bacterium]